MGINCIQIIAWQKRHPQVLELILKDRFPCVQSKALVLILFLLWSFLRPFPSDVVSPRSCASSVHILVHTCTYISESKMHRIVCVLICFTRLWVSWKQGPLLQFIFEPQLFLTYQILPISYTARSGLRVDSKWWVRIYNLMKK